MASSEEDGAAAAAEQLGSMSLGNTEPAANIGAATKLCSACGTESDTAEKCNECECVWYCDKDCKDGHRKEHEKECELIKTVIDQRGGKLDIGTEVDIGPLGKLPPQEECPICLQALPLCEMLHRYNVCCGKTLCSGCSLQHRMMQTELAVPITCPFCRTAGMGEGSDEEHYLVQLRKRTERKDPTALRHLAMAYRFGGHGLSVDQAKCIDLLRESADLGDPDAQCKLGLYHNNGQLGLEQNTEEAAKYWEKAAEGGNVFAQHSLGCKKYNSGDVIAAMRHWRLSTSGGFKPSMKFLIDCFKIGSLRHGDLAETMRAFYRSRAELTNEGRNQCIAYFEIKRDQEFNSLEVMDR